MQYTSKAVYEFISAQTNDPIVERKTCRVSGTQFPIFQSELDFYKKISPTFDGKKFHIPTPTLCPEERERRRLMHRNERQYYRTTCALSGEPTVSLYSPDRPWKVYKNKLRFSDTWDATDYAQDINPDATFTNQLSALTLQVPTPDMMRVDCENSDYTSGTGFCKDCYMICASEYAENCLYSKLVQTAEYVVDSINIFSSQHIYQGSNLKECNTCMYLSNSIGCYRCHFSQGLIGCSYCLFCDNLQNKSYHIHNKPVSKEEFDQAYARYITNEQGNTEAKEIYKNQMKNSVLKQAESKNSELAFGNELFDCKNVVLGFSMNEAHDCRYCTIAEKVKTVQDCNNVYVHQELCYEVMGAMQSYNCHFSCYLFENSRDIWYSMNCHNCQNCFGCIGLRNKSYCIFNKQYTQETYEQKVAEIITRMQETGERGEFFDYSLSPFGYNQSVAQDIYPLNKEEAAARGYLRSDYSNDPKIPENAVVIDAASTDAATWHSYSQDDAILRQVIICAHSKRPFITQKKELDFYRLHGLPLPRLHPDVRYTLRIQEKPQKILHLRNCDKTGEQILSVYPANYPGKVYSEKAYQEEVFG